MMPSVWYRVLFWGSWSHYGILCFIVKIWFFFLSSDFKLYRKLRKATIRFVMSVRPSVRMGQLGSHWTDFHDISYLSVFRKTYRGNSSCINIWKKQLVFCMKACVHLWHHLAKFFSEWEMFQTKVADKIKTHFLCSMTLFEYRAVYEIRLRNVVEADRPQMTK
jgi:hypothetical protein